MEDLESDYDGDIELGESAGFSDGEDLGADSDVELLEDCSEKPK